MTKLISVNNYSSVPVIRVFDVRTSFAISIRNLNKVIAISIVKFIDRVVRLFKLDTKPIDYRIRV